MPLHTRLYGVLFRHRGRRRNKRNSILGNIGRCYNQSNSSPTPLQREGVKDRFDEPGQADEMVDLMEIISPHIVSAAIKAI